MQTAAGGRLSGSHSAGALCGTRAQRAAARGRASKRRRAFPFSPTPPSTVDTPTTTTPDPSRHSPSCQRPPPCMDPMDVPPLPTPDSALGVAHSPPPAETPRRPHLRQLSLASGPLLPRTTSSPPSGASTPTGTPRSSPPPSSLTRPGSAGRRATRQSSISYSPSLRTVSDATANGSENGPPAVTGGARIPLGGGSGRVFSRAPAAIQEDDDETASSVGRARSSRSSLSIGSASSFTDRESPATPKEPLTVVDQCVRPSCLSPSRTCVLLLETTQDGKLTAGCPCCHATPPQVRVAPVVHRSQGGRHPRPPQHARRAREGARRPQGTVAAARGDGVRTRRRARHLGLDIAAARLCGLGPQRQRLGAHRRPGGRGHGQVALVGPCQRRWRRHRLGQEVRRSGDRPQRQRAVSRRAVSSRAHTRSTRLTSIPPPFLLRAPAASSSPSARRCRSRRR